MVKKSFQMLTLSKFNTACVTFPLQLAEYRQRKAHADSQKKQKKKKKKKTGDDLEGDSQERGEADPDQSVDTEEVSSGGQDGMKEGARDPPTTEFTFAKTLRSGESVKHDQTYTIEVLQTHPLTL